MKKRNGIPNGPARSITHQDRHEWRAALAEVRAAGAQLALAQVAHGQAQQALDGLQRRMGATYALSPHHEVNLDTGAISRKDAAPAAAPAPEAAS